MLISHSLLLLHTHATAVPPHGWTGIIAAAETVLADVTTLAALRNAPLAAMYESASRHRRHSSSVVPLHRVVFSVLVLRSLPAQPRAMALVARLRPLLRTAPMPRRVAGGLQEAVGTEPERAAKCRSCDDVVSTLSVAEGVTMMHHVRAEAVVPA